MENDKRKQKVIKAIQDKKIVDNTSFTVFQMIEDLNDRLDTEIPKLDETIREILPRIKGDKGDTPVVGIDFEQPKDGYTPQKGIDYNDGESYVLTEEDKQAIAQSIKVPVVEKEVKTIVEKTEVIRETPIVTENVVEKALYEEPIVIAEKLNTLKEAIDSSVIKGFADLERISKLNAFNPTMGPSFADIAGLNKRIVTLEANPGGGLADAPSDGNTYGRKNADWVTVTGGSAAWGSIGAGTGVGSQTDLVTYLNSNYQGKLTLTTTGSSGAATLIGNTLNIPQYSGGGMVYPSAGIAVSTGSAWASSISGTSSQFVKGDGSLDSSTYLTASSLTGYLKTDGSTTGATSQMQVFTKEVSTKGLLATGIFGGSYTDGVVIDYNNPDGRIIVGSADTISFYNNGISSPFKLGSFSTTGDLTATATFQTSVNNSTTGAKTIIGGKYSHFGLGIPNQTVIANYTSSAIELSDSDNTAQGVNFVISNTAPLAAGGNVNAYTSFSLVNDLASDGSGTHFFAIAKNSSGYTNTAFGTLIQYPNQVAFQETEGPITFVAMNATPQYINFAIGGANISNEVGRWTTTGLTVGLAGTLTGLIKFAGITSGAISVQGVATGSGTNTLQAVTDTFVYRATTDTLTNKRITKRVVTAADATSITPNSDNADMTYQSNSQALGTLTINADVGTPTNGQSWMLKIKSTNAQTFSWNAQFIAGATGALPTTTSGSGKINYFPFIFDTINNKWNYSLSLSGGF